MVAAGDVRRRHHLRLKVRGASVRSECGGPELTDGFGVRVGGRILGRGADPAALEGKNGAEAGAGGSQRGLWVEGLCCSGLRFVWGRIWGLR